MSGKYPVCDKNRKADCFALTEGGRCFILAEVPPGEKCSFYKPGWTVGHTAMETQKMLDKIQRGHKKP